tara:strand:+ start:397 stop:684 length:288 start_codon:yes stop_codon:yes gene_type:complete
MKTKYRTIEGQDEGNIRILDERFNGVAVSLGRIAIVPLEDSDKATLKYDYDILEIPEGMELDEEFETLLGDIVIDILENKLEEDPNSLRFNDSAD